MVKATRRKDMKKIQVKKMNSKGTRKAPLKKNKHRITRRRRGGADHGKKKLTRAQIKDKNKLPKAQDGYEKKFDETIDGFIYQKIGDVEGPETYSIADAFKMRKDRTLPRDLLIAAAGPRTPPSSPPYGPSAAAGPTTPPGSPSYGPSAAAGPRTPPGSPTYGPGDSFSDFVDYSASTPPSSPPAPAIPESQDDDMDTTEGADDNDGCGHLRERIKSLEQEVLTKHQQFQSQDQHLRGLHERLNAQDAELHQYHAHNQELQGQLGQYQAYVADLERQVQQGATANPCHRYIEALEEIKNHLEQKGTLTNAEFNQMSNVIFLQMLRM